MDVRAAQADVRAVYRRGSVGQVVTGFVWAVAAAAALFGAGVIAPLILFFGGMLIFPLTTLGLMLLGGPAELEKGHPSASLAFQLAMQVPLGLLVALLLWMSVPELFFPAAMVIVGGHYLPFTSLYGMREYTVLGCVLIAGGVAVGFGAPGLHAVAAAATSVVLVGFGVLQWVRDRRDRAA